MKRNYLALFALLCCGTSFATEGNPADYQRAFDVSEPIAQVACQQCGEVFDGKEPCRCGIAQPSCGLKPSDGFESLDNRDNNCADGSSIFDRGCECNLGDPLVLFGNCGNFSMGGWASVGYHSEALPGTFNTRPDEVQLHQAWLYAEKALDTSNGFDFGGRIDYIYGTDGPDTQAFGIDNDHWDNGWDHGADYGHAIPQLYGEVGYGDWSIKAGHFYTLIGYEVVQSTGNFFYSHSYAMYSSESFTHSGALAKYSGMEKLTLFGGYVMGFDSAFEDNGDSVLGGAALALGDDVVVTYSAVGGIFANNQDRFEKGYLHSLVADVSLTDKLQYVFQTDLLTTDDRVGDKVRESFDISQYLIRQINDCFALGARFEWYQTEGTANVPVGQKSDIYALTLGVNYRPHANVTIRPEMRWDWDDNEFVGLKKGDRQSTFGIDSVVTF